MRTPHPRARVGLCVGFAAPLLMGASCSPIEIAGGVVGVTALGAYAPAHEIEQTYYIGTFDRQGQLPPEFYRITVRGQASIISSARFGSGWVPAQLVDSLAGQVVQKHDNGAKQKGEDAGGEKGEICVEVHISLDELQAAAGQEPEPQKTKKEDEPQGSGEADEQSEEEAQETPTAKAEVCTKDQGTPSLVDLQEGRALVQFGPEGFRTAPREHRLVIVMGASPEAFFSAIDQSLGTVARIQQIQRQEAASRELFAEYIRLSREHDHWKSLEKGLEVRAARQGDPGR